MKTDQTNYKKKMEVFLADKPTLSKKFMKYVGNDDEFFNYSNLQTRQDLQASKTNISTY